MTACKLTEMPEFKLVEGVGDYSRNQACVMSAAVACYRLARGEPLGQATDQLECCDPLIRSFLIAFNDNFQHFVKVTDKTIDQQRTETLMPFVPRLIDTKRLDVYTAIARNYVVANWLMKEVVPIGLDLAGFTAKAARFREWSEIADMDSLVAANKELNAVGDIFKYENACWPTASWAVSEVRHVFSAIRLDPWYRQAIASSAFAAAKYFAACAHGNTTVQQKLLACCCSLVDKLIRVTEDKQTPAAV